MSTMYKLHPSIEGTSHLHHLQRYSFKNINSCDKIKFMSTSEQHLTKHESFDCLNRWASAVSRQDISTVLGCYHSSASLWPTLSNTLRTNPEQLEDYFKGFLPKISGSVEWNECVFQSISQHTALWSGSYTFSTNNGPAHARFTYLLTKEGDLWKIQHHHSSLMPNPK